MSADNNQGKTDWSLKELSEVEQSNLLRFFALLLKVDKRINPQIYANNGNSDNTD